MIKILLTEVLYKFRTINSTQSHAPLSKIHQNYPRNFQFLNWHVSTHTYVVTENIPFITNPLLTLLTSAFFSKKSAFYGQNSTFTRSNIVRAVLRVFLVLFSVFVR